LPTFKLMRHFWYMPIVNIRVKENLITIRRRTMAITEVKRIHTANEPDGNYIEDPKIVKVAKFTLILADEDTSVDEKLLCVKVAERYGYITGEEAKQLLLYRAELERL